MDSDWLADRLEAGRSIESIARETGKSPSSVAYWVNKHGLASVHAGRHRLRDPIPQRRLEEMVEEGLSIRQIAAEVDRSYTTVRHWLGRYGLATRPSRYSRRDAPKPEVLLRECDVHGWTRHVRTGASGGYRCRRCNSESVAARRRRIKAILVEEAGGGCTACGFDSYLGALQFHHRDPAEKVFSLSRHGVTRSLSAARREARKCVLLCANCHAMAEAGLLLVPAAADTESSPSAGGSDPG